MSVINNEGYETMATKITFDGNWARIAGAPYRIDARTGDPETFTVSAVGPGGYLRFGDGSQVCENMSTRGNAVAWDEGLTFKDVVRGQHRAAMASYKRLAGA